MYRSSDSKLIGTYEYDLWGKPIGIKEATPGIDTDGILTKNPLRYRSYYYDSETGFYNLNARYYDPAIRRFISADSPTVLMIATVSLDCKNLFSYAENNPVMAKDSSGGVVETVFDVITIGISVVDVCCNPTDPWAWAGLAGDCIDLIPFVTGVGEGVKGLRLLAKAADKTMDVADTMHDTAKAADRISDSVRQLDNVSDAAKAAKKSGSGTKKPYATSRPNYGKGQVEQVWENAKDPITGKVYDPSGVEITWDPTKPRNGQWDMGHIPGEKYSEIHQLYMDDVITKDEFLEWYRNPNNYRPELPSTNRSHKYE